MKTKKSLGNLGEAFVRGHLNRLGYRIIQSPFRCKIGEIDVVAMDGDILVFIEVKTRRSERYGTALEAVTVKKQRQIIRTAQFYLRYARKPVFKTCRFDVVGVLQKPGNSPPEITHAKDAFRQNF